MEAHLAPKQPVQVNKITSTCEICSGPHATQYCMEKPEQAFVKYASARTDEVRGKCYTFKPEQNNLGDTYNLTWKSHPNLRDVEVHIGRLKLLNDFYIIDMKKDLKTPLLARRGFLATANTIIDCRKAKIKVGERITRLIFGVKGIKLGIFDEKKLEVLRKFHMTILGGRFNLLSHVSSPLWSKPWEY
nr:MAK10-like protein [Tanacetum cinerariifolium]